VARDRPGAARPCARAGGGGGGCGRGILACQRAPALDADEGAGDLYFFRLHVRWLIVGLIAMFIASLLPKETTRRLAILLGGRDAVGAGAGADCGQRSERRPALAVDRFQFASRPNSSNPASAIAVAWIPSWRVRDPGIPVIAISIGLMLLVAALLMAQPDFGSHRAVRRVWFVLVLLSGLSLTRIGWSAGLGVFGVVMAYRSLSQRHTPGIDAFVSGGSGSIKRISLCARSSAAAGAVPASGSARARWRCPRRIPMISLR